MIESLWNMPIGQSNLTAFLNFLRSPQNAEIYNGAIILLLTVIGIALSWGCVQLTKSFTATNNANPRQLFLQLCRAHQLSSSERRQLEQLAELVGLDTPAVLMIDASRWQLEQLTREKKLVPKQHERLLTLQKMLYDQPRLQVAR